MPVVHLQLLPSGTSALTSFVAGDDHALIPLPPSLLFPARSGSSATLQSDVAPLAVLMAPGASRLIFKEDIHNMGLDWRSAVRRFFGASGGGLASEAERLVEEYALSPHDGEQALAVVDILPATATELAGDLGTENIDAAAEFEEALE